MRTAMPSPRGTNVEGLFVSGRNAGAAYDAVEGLGMNEDKISDLLDFLKGKLSEADMKDLVELLSKGSDVALDAKLRRRTTESIIARRSSDAAAFAKRFPDAARIGFAL